MSTSEYKNKLQGEHLDAMIRMALLQDENEKVSELVNSSDPELSQEIERSVDSAYVRALKKVEKDGSTEKRKKTIKTIYRAMTNGLKIAAAIALIVVVATPIAIASSSAFRSTVLKLIMGIDEERNEVNFSFIEDSDMVPDVPDLWRGEYFPAYLPEGIHQSFMNREGTYVEFEGEENRKIAFSEYDEQTSLMAGIEGAEIDTITLSNGETAYLIMSNIAEQQTVSVTWSIGDKWFDLATYEYSRDQAIQIAESVEKIIKQ